MHLIVDNYATHKHARVKAWLAARPRYHIHYTPTYASWINQVERWFGIITEQAIRRGSFTSVSGTAHWLSWLRSAFTETSRVAVTAPRS